MTVVNINEGVNFFCKGVNIVHVHCMSQSCYQHQDDVETFILEGSLWFSENEVGLENHDDSCKADQSQGEIDEV